MNLSEKLKEIRRLLGVSQKEMGQMLEIPQVTYSNYENETRQMPREVLSLLSQIGVDTSWLLNDTSNYFGHRMLCSVFYDKGKYTIEATAEQLGIPPAFLQAAKEGTISPSTEFIERVFRDGLKMKLPDANFFDKIKDEAETLKSTETLAGLKNENLGLHVRLDRAETTVDYLAEQLANANRKIDELTAKLSTPPA